MAELADCSKEQLLLFYEKAQVVDKQRRSFFIADVRAAVWADGKEFERLLDILEGNKK